MTNANKTRARLLSLSPKLIRREVVTIEVPGEDPIKVEVRSPTIAQSAAFSDSSRSSDTATQTRLMADIVISCSYDAETGERLFSPADADVILEDPTDGWVSPLVNAVTGLLGSAEKAAKN
jgi:hypothetical protein